MGASYQSKKFVRNKLTGQLLTENGEWTANPAEAYDFPSFDEVVTMCAQHHLDAVELLLRAPDRDVAVPIDPST